MNLGALVKAAHPGPSLAVTAIGTTLGATAGAPGARCVLLAAALLAGQLSIGWCNDAVDRERDIAAARPDKPVALGTVSRGAVATAAAVALTVCVPLSLALGAAAGAVHLVAVASAWAYDLWLKRTAWSFVPFAVSFGLLPSVATLSLPHPVVAPAWATTAGALLGVVAHLANALPDIEDDAAAGVAGLPARVGPTVTRALSGVLLVLAAVVLVVGPSVPLGAAGLLLVLVTMAGLVAAFARRWPPRSRAPFALTVVATLAVVGLLVARGTALG